MTTGWGATDRESADVTPDPGFAGLPYSQQGFAGKLPASMTQPVDFDDDTDELTEHVSIRFPADMIAAAKQLAAAEGMTVSAWIRREVEREARRRERPAPESGTALYLSAVARLSAGLRDIRHACKRGDAPYAIVPVAAAALADVDRLRLPQPPAAPVLHQLSGLIAGWRQAVSELAGQPMSSDETAEAETLGEVIRQVLTVIESAAFDADAASLDELQPQPAPELAAAIAETRERIARQMEGLAANYPEDVFPAASDSRDAVSGTAMRHAYRTAARLIRAASAEQEES